MVRPGVHGRDAVKFAIGGSVLSFRFANSTMHPNEGDDRG